MNSVEVVGFPLIRSCRFDANKLGTLVGAVNTGWSQTKVVLRI